MKTQKQKNLGGAFVTITVRFKVEVTLLSALKLRLMGSRSADRLMQPIIERMRRKLK